MFRKKLREDEISETGIGTMSLFVSLILIASIAGGTLVSSGLILKNDAEETYSKALEEIITGLNIIALKGDRGRDSFASNPIDPNAPNVGTGVLNGITTSNSATISETWTITCIKEIENGGIFRVNGSKSGLQKDYNITNGRYFSDNYEVSFEILPGDIDFAIGDDFQFNTTSYKLYGSIQKLEITLATRIGSPKINMSQTLIEITDEKEQFLLKYSENSSSYSYFAIALRDPNGVWKTDKIVGDGTLIKVIIDCTNIGMNLTKDNDLVIRIMPENGIPTYESTKIPSVLGGRYVELY